MVVSTVWLEEGGRVVSEQEVSWTLDTHCNKTTQI